MKTLHLQTASTVYEDSQNLLKKISIQFTLYPTSK
jgi:hypothetical protein